MKRIVLAVIALLLSVGGLVACPSVSYSPSYHSASYAAPYVSPVYPSVATTEVSVRINLAQYSAYLAPAIAVPYVQPPVPAAALIPQTPTVAIAAPVAAVAAAPVCPPAAMPAPVAAAASEDFCKLVLARLDKIDAKQSAFEAQLRGGPQVTAPAPKPEAVVPGAVPKSVGQSCVRCHTQGKEFTDPATGMKAPTYFSAEGVCLMTDRQLRKAVHAVEDGTMPLKDSAEAKALTPDAANALLYDLGSMPGAETKPTPAPVPNP